MKFVYEFEDERVLAPERVGDRKLVDENGRRRGVACMFANMMIKNPMPSPSTKPSKPVNAWPGRKTSKLASLAVRTS